MDNVHTDIISIPRSDRRAPVPVSRASFLRRNTVQLQKQTMPLYVQTEMNNREVLQPEAVCLYLHHTGLIRATRFFNNTLHNNKSMIKAAAMTTPVFLIFGIKRNRTVNMIQKIPAFPSFVTDVINLSSTGVCKVRNQSRIFSSIFIAFIPFFQSAELSHFSINQKYFVSLIDIQFI